MEVAVLYIGRFRKVIVPIPRVQICLGSVLRQSPEKCGMASQIFTGLDKLPSDSRRLGFSPEDTYNQEVRPAHH